jgi:hypothetical protein
MLVFVAELAEAALLRHACRVCRVCRVYRAFLERLLPPVLLVHTASHILLHHLLLHTCVVAPYYRLTIALISP